LIAELCVPLQRTKPPSERRRLGAPGRGAALALLTCILVSHTLPASAASTPSTAGASNDPQRRALAKAKYQQGVEAYRAERYADAVRLFLEADALEPSAALSYNIARAYEKLADDAQTLRWYRNYLRLNPEAPNAADVQQFVRTLSEALAKKGIQQLSVLSTPSGATVAIDGSPLGVTPLTVELPPGAHSALLTLRGFSDAQVRFTLAAATPIDLPVQLQPAPTSPGAVAAAEPRGRRFGIAPYITLGAGAALLGTAALFEHGRRSAQSAAKTDITQLDTERDVNAMNSRQTAARVFVGVGAAVTITGAALLVFNTRLTPETRASASALPGGGALLLERSF
jgi:tetratricopeptide (TPR) repeat protein